MFSYLKCDGPVNEFLLQLWNIVKSVRFIFFRDQGHYSIRVLLSDYRITLIYSVYELFTEVDNAICTMLQDTYYTYYVYINMCIYVLNTCTYIPMYAPTYIIYYVLCIMYYILYIIYHIYAYTRARSTKLRCLVH
jgi:hypothetical protein